MKKYTYWITGLVLLLAVLSFVFSDKIKALFGAEKSIALDYQNSDEPIDPEPDPEDIPSDLTPLEYKMVNYDTYLARTKILMWVEMFKLCPYWTAFVTDTYNRYKDNKQNKGITLEDRFFIVAQEFIDASADILEKYGRCDLKYTRAKGNAEYNAIGLKSM